MFLNLKSQTNKIIILILLPIFFISIFDEASARKRRKYNPKATREQAIDIIRTNSSTVSELAGLEQADENSLQFNLNDDGEDLTVECTIGDIGEDIDELEQEDDIAINIDDLKTLWLQFVSGMSETTAYGIKKTDLMDNIMDWLGTPYRFGGTSNRAIDCSAWTQRVFTETANVMIPRTAREQVNVGKKITRNELEFGDMVFFHTYSRRFASHVGIYLGDNLFAHASSRFGVTVSSLESTYYRTRFIGGRRLTPKDMEKMALSKPSEKKHADAR